MERESPEFVHYGVHAVASQNRHGELTVGASHEYGDPDGPSDYPEVDKLILHALGSLVAPDIQVTVWHANFAEHPAEAYCVVEPAPGVAAAAGLAARG